MHSLPFYNTFHSVQLTISVALLILTFPEHKFIDSEKIALSIGLMEQCVFEIHTYLAAYLLGTDIQLCLGTLEHCWRGTLLHCSFGTVEHSCLGTWRSTGLHSCLGTLEHCSVGTCSQTCRGTEEHSSLGTLLKNELVTLKILRQSN